MPHDLAHVLDGGSAGIGHGSIDQGGNFVIAELLGQVILDDAQFTDFHGDQVITAGFFKLANRFTPLLAHLVEYQQYLRVIQLNTLIHLDLFNRRGNQANSGQTLLFPGAHGVLHVLLNAVLEGHARRD